MQTKKKNVLRAYFRWPFYLGIVLAVLAVGSLFVDAKIGALLLIITGVYFLAAVVNYICYRRSILKKLVDFGAEYAQAQNQMLRQIDLPFAMCNSTGDVFWSNPAFMKDFNLTRKQSALTSLFPELEAVDLKTVETVHVSFGDKRYVLNLAPIHTENIQEMQELDDSDDNVLFNVFLLDETDLLYYRKTLEEERAVMALIYFDNYEEVMSGIEYVRRSLLSALLERKLNKYVSGIKGVVRKLEKDRFFLVMRQEALWELQQNNFSLLEDIKTVNIGNEMAVTISMGIGLGGESFEQNYDYARTAIEMALGRGGDQVVLKNGSDIRYYGGKAKTTERNTRVKARTKAHALRELIEARESVMIMGHPISDLDCIGAAMGIYRAAKFSEKRVHIVIGDVSNSVKPLLDTFRNNPEYEEDLFVDRSRALELLDRDTLLVVVDTNRPSYTECPELLKRATSVVVMDHHRQGRETIENTMLSYVEPYASSASEMVAEVVQYYDDRLKLKSAEADAVFAGIVMDTNNFEDKSGVRTFEAAAYLRRNGADVTRVRKLFRDNMEDYKLRAETVQAAEVFDKDYIISICPNHGTSANQTVVAAQAANELLEIKGIKASFVLTEFENKIYISARSIDEVNVQVIMEKLGGGGHQSVAGAQLVDNTIEEAREKLRRVIRGLDQ